MSAHSHPTLSDCMTAYLETIRQARSPGTARTYANAVRRFARSLSGSGMDPENTSPAALSEMAVSAFVRDLGSVQPATERLYLTVMYNFYQYLLAEDLSQVNLIKLRALIKARSRRLGHRLPKFPQDDLELLITFAINLKSAPAEKISDRLINLRDRALILTLADTGLRIHEAVGLRRGDVDMDRRLAILIGKGNKEALVRFSRRSVQAIHDYLRERTRVLDGNSGHPLTSLPIFARHDRGAGRRVLPITTKTGRKIVEGRAAQALGDRGEITPHKLRHRFVTEVLRATHNIKLAQQLARHESTTITERYIHLTDVELDQGYKQVFERK